MTQSAQGGQFQTDLNDPDVARLLAGRLHDPRRVLGIHTLGNREIVVRVLLPNATKASLVAPAVELKRVGQTALFEWVGPPRMLTAPYRVRWQSHTDDWHESFDPYSFAPQLDQSDLSLFAGGNHHHAHRFLGAHQVRVGDVLGTRFAVWAPNAERVSVVGTFNHWDGRHHPMTVRGDSGVWELFIPELKDGELYKYEIFGRDSRELRIKSDPYGAMFER
ncbi:MAG TPA: 1,4-alpha-glucan branching enzyme, partial [Gammaproteobacteria bacterium]|nr:1,4-alpha-glucan branching enzyme [Gammaproteobacteria bacterium]